VFSGGAGQGGELAVTGRLVGADASRVYVSLPGKDGSSQLWSMPLSGGTPTLAAQVPAGTPAPWNQVDDPRSPVWFAGNVMVTVQPQSGPGGSLSLYLIVVPLR
jgi:hypothetical protein